MTNERILIVDDNPSNVKLVRLLLEKAGYEVRVAGHSAQALEALPSFSPHLILMDIQLPGMDGLSLTRQLKEDKTTRDSIIVAVTAYAMPGDQERAEAAGCDGYISKPINTRTFVDQIRSYLKASPEKPVVQQDADPSDLLQELRNGFVAEGAELSRQYAATAPSGDEADAMRRVVHHWVGMGGTLGFPEVTAAASELEGILQSTPIQWAQRARQGFAEINSLFGRSMGSGLPFGTEGVAPDLAFKQIGLIGFPESQSLRVRSAFDKVKAVARDLGDLSAGLGMDALHTHDLIVLNACTAEGVRSWDSVFAQPLLQKPVLVVASRSALLDSKLALAERAVDFVLEPWDSEELLCRAQKVIGQKASVPQQQTERKGKPKVVLADDDPIIHALLTPMLAKLGMDCYAAHDGLEALDAVSRLSPDVLILDIGMPRMNGISVLREIRKVQQNRDLGILMLTARQQRNDMSMALAYGANDYATKPFDPEDLMIRIRRLVPQQTGLTPDRD
jgi:two-component system, cell cycle response regulator DivK